MASSTPLVSSPAALITITFTNPNDELIQAALEQHRNDPVEIRCTGLISQISKTGIEALNKFTRLKSLELIVGNSLSDRDLSELYIPSLEKVKVSMTMSRATANFNLLSLWYCQNLKEIDVSNCQFKEFQNPANYRRHFNHLNRLTIGTRKGYEQYSSMFDGTIGHNLIFKENGEMSDIAIQAPGYTYDDFLK